MSAGIEAVSGSFVVNHIDNHGNYYEGSERKDVARRGVSVACVVCGGAFNKAFPCYAPALLPPYRWAGEALERPGDEALIPSQMHVYCDSTDAVPCDEVGCTPE